MNLLFSILFFWKFFPACQTWGTYGSPTIVSPTEGSVTTADDRGGEFRLALTVSNMSKQLLTSQFLTIDMLFLQLLTKKVIVIQSFSYLEHFSIFLLSNFRLIVEFHCTHDFQWRFSS